LRRFAAIFEWLSLQFSLQFFYGPVPPLHADHGSYHNCFPLKNQPHASGAEAVRFFSPATLEPGNKMKLQKSHVDENSAAEFLDLDVTTLRDWRLRKTGPEYCKFGRAVRYPIEALTQFAQQARVPVSSHGAR